MLGVSRDTFYRYMEAVSNGGMDALLEKSRRESNEKTVLTYVLQEPAQGQVRISARLRKRGVLVLPCGVRSICPLTVADYWG